MDFEKNKFILCFENHREDGKVWSVRQGGVWQTVKEVHIYCPVSTHYEGKDAEQPVAYLCGEGTIRVLNDDCLEIF